MKRITYTLFLLLQLLTYSGVIAQTAKEYLDINNVKALILNRGDMFYDPGLLRQSYQFPKDSATNATGLSCLWIGGYNSSTGSLHIAAQTYRNLGTDYSSGPLDQNGVCDIITSNDWDRLWKVNKTDIDDFKQITSHTIANTPISILEWPAKGNLLAKGKSGVLLSVQDDAAPFIDVNGDGIYSALTGDYPDILGGQAVFTIFNDNTQPHSGTGALPMRIEVHLLAYACADQTMANATIYKYKIINKSTNQYDNVIISLFNEFDLGNPYDDYFGCDTTLRMGIVYNGDTMDASAGSIIKGYSKKIPQTGCMILKQPGDLPNLKSPLGAFIYSNSSNSPIYGAPFIPEDYYNYMKGNWKNGQALSQSCNGRDSSLPSTSFYMPEDPSIAFGASEKSCNNTPQNKRSNLSTSPFTIKPGHTVEFVSATITSDIGSSNANFSALKQKAIAVLNNYETCQGAVLNVFDIDMPDVFVFPNPCSSKLHISNPDEKIKLIEIYSITGQRILSMNVQVKKDFDLHLGELESGNYILKCTTKNQAIVKKIIVTH